MTWSCALCGRSGRGALLLARDRATGEVTAVCRPTIDARCFGSIVGNGDEIRLLDPDAARKFDRESAGLRPELIPSSRAAMKRLAHALAEGRL